MPKRFSSLLCTSRRKNSFDDQDISIYDGINEIQIASIEETSSVYVFLAQSEETIPNHRARNRSGIFTRTFSRFYQRISNSFRRRSSAAFPLVQPEITPRNEHENIYETISLDPACRHTKYTTDSIDCCVTTLITRSPPEITWKHSWSMIKIENALITSPFSSIPTEIYLQIFQFLSVTDLGNVSLVCRHFKMIADHDAIWKLKCRTSNKLLSKSFKEIYMDWMYEKYLRNKELRELANKYQTKYRYITSFVDTFDIDSEESFSYPYQSATQVFFSSVAGFRRHPNSSQEMTIQLTVDLDRTLPELISLFEKISIFQVYWYQPIVIKQMILRYYRFMKLKALSLSNIILVPTLDIEMIWQTHLSHPQMYRTDCLRLFGRIIDHSLLTDDIGQFLKEQAFIETCRLYKEHFDEEYCSLPIDIENRKRTPKYEEIPSDGDHRCLIPVYSYWDETYFDFATEISNDYENPFSFTEADVIADSHWFNSYKSFMYEMRWKISNGNGRFLLENNNKLDSFSIKLMKKSYERFLYMTAKYSATNGPVSINPTYAIDLLWRCHKQQPLQYAYDCLKFVGSVVDGDSWSLLETDQDIVKADEKTNSIWKKEFNNDITSDHLHRIDDLNYSSDSSSLDSLY